MISPVRCVQTSPTASRKVVVTLCFFLLSAISLGLSAAAQIAAAKTPDPVLQWIGILNDTAIAQNTSPLATSREGALLSASVFDAVNGIEPRYRPLYVKPHAKHPASQSAAAIEAAYIILVNAYPNLSGDLTAKRNASLAALNESVESINNGIAWGQDVADAIWKMRLTDGIAPPPPPFLGANVKGVWRPTEPLYAPGAGSQFATMTPWVLKRPSQFRLPVQYALISPEFLADLNETKTMGVFSGSGRTADQSELALFWNGNTPLYWNRIAVQLATNSALSLAENAHLFALLNLTMADAAIACWDTKYRFVFWRPITAIQTGIAGIVAPDPNWVPWLDPPNFAAGTPAFPEYPSGHATVSGSAAFILGAAFGDNTSFTVTSDVRPGTRSFASFSAAVSEIADARVFGGIHFRTSCTLGNVLGREVAKYVSKHVMRGWGDSDEGEDEEDQ
jgi:PAP2 superfamily protein